MADISLEQLNELFDTKLAPIHEELKGVNKRLDTVASHLEKVEQRVAAVETVQHGNSQTLDKLDRTISKHLDRLDDQGTRIEALESKTAHLSTPTSP